MSTTKKVGVIGAGSFGTAISNLIALNRIEVLLYSRRQNVIDKINQERKHYGIPISEHIELTNDIEKVAKECTVIFPIVPSSAFRETMKNLGPFLKPYHILIHGTKGFDLKEVTEEALMARQVNIMRKHVCTMSEVIRQESIVVKIGCLSGPNLASEILEGQPTATVIASQFTEVIKAGQGILDSAKFHVFGSHEILGAELAGALKNIIALGSGILGGMGMGKNIQAMLITRGLTEMINYGKAMGSTAQPFLGTAGIGDLVATATSKKSRNYTFGYRIGQGETPEDIFMSMPELAEGARTLKIARGLARHYKLHVPITEMLYNVVFEGFDKKRALYYLMKYPYAVDVDFL
ncbi:MAG: NAD(P)H-dependent glycerol-3-phosphate dehydrogenase [Saprospiraceae bacterium]